MYNIWCELKKEYLAISILSILFTILDFYIHKKIDYTLLLLDFAWFLILLSRIKKYLFLKKYGILLNLPYVLEDKGKNGKFIIINYVTSEGKNVRFVKPDIKVKDIPNNGYINVLVNLNNTKEFYIFHPKNNNI